MDNFLRIIELSNLHSSMIVCILSIAMLINIKKEHQYIKNLTNGRKQLFMALIGIFVIMCLRSVHSILSYFFIEVMSSAMNLAGFILNILSMSVLGNFITTKYKIHKGTK